MSTAGRPRGISGRAPAHRRSMGLPFLTLICLGLTLIGRPSRAGNWSAPPPLSPEEINAAKAVVTDPKQSPAAKVAAVRRIMERAGGPEKRRLLAEVAGVPGQHPAVRLACLHGLEWGKAAPEIKAEIVEAIREALALRDAFALKLAAEAIRSGWGFGWHSRDEGRRRLALLAVSHSEAVVRVAGLMALGHCGTAADAGLFERSLANPRSREFRAALDAVGRNEAVAEPLRGELLEMARGAVADARIRVYALAAIPAPYTKEHLEVATDLYPKVLRDSYCRGKIVRSIREKAPVELGMPYLIRYVRMRDGDPSVEQHRVWGLLHAIREYLRDRDPKLREAAARALPLWLVRECLVHENKLVRDNAARLVPYYGPRAKALFPDLAAFLRVEQDAYLQEQTLWMIDERLGAEAKPLVPAISHLLLRSGDRSVRSCAFRRLCKLAEPRELVPVIAKLLQQVELLNNDKYGLRSRAIRVAGEIGPRAASLLPQLRKLANAKGPDWYTRELAQGAIAEIEKRAASEGSTSGKREGAVK